MSITPFNNMVLVRPIKEETKESKIFLPESHIGRFVKYEVIEVGAEAPWITPGDIVIANPSPEDEVVNKAGLKLVNCRDILAKEEAD